tara:strand:- start:2096 stop:2299 length:204 start_codon:yes stop_codon:yes gene_type:complete
VDYDEALENRLYLTGKVLKGMVYVKAEGFAKDAHLQKWVDSFAKNQFVCSFKRFRLRFSLISFHFYV